MKKSGIVAYYIFIACLLFIITGVFYGWLTFGHGLGDLFYLICLAPVTIVLTALLSSYEKKLLILHCRCCCF
jgi:hypothetical protein